MTFVLLVSYGRFLWQRIWVLGLHSLIVVQQLWRPSTRYLRIEVVQMEDVEAKLKAFAYSDGCGIAFDQTGGHPSCPTHYCGNPMF